MDTPAPLIIEEDIDLSLSPYQVDLFSMPSGQVEGYISSTKAIPESLQNILTKDPTVIFLTDTAAKFKLDDAQTRDLSRLIRDLLLGELYLGDAPRAFVDRLRVPEGVAASILKSVINDLFKEAYEDVKKVQVEKFRSRIHKQANQEPIDATRPPENEIIPEPIMPENPHNVLDLGEASQTTDAQS